MTVLLEYLDLDCSIRVSRVTEALSKGGSMEPFEPLDPPLLWNNVMVHMGLHSYDTYDHLVKHLSYCIIITVICFCHYILQFYPFGNDSGDTVLVGEGSSPSITLSEDFVIYNQVVRTTYVC